MEKLLKKFLKRYETYFCAVLTVIVWGVVPALAKKALEVVQDVYIVIFYVNLTAVLFFGLYITVIKKWRSFSTYKFKDILIMLSIGAIWPLAYSIFYFEGINRTSPSMMTIINYTWPIFLVLLASVILKEQISKPKIIGVIFGFLGVALSYGYLAKIKFFPGFNWGLLFFLGLSAAFFQALYVIFDEKYKKKLEKDRKVKENGGIFDTVSRVFIYEILTVAVITLIIALVPSSHFTFPPWTPLIMLVFIGGFSNGVGFVTFTRAMKGEKKTSAATIICFTPLVQLIILLWMGVESLPIIIMGISGVLMVCGFWFTTKKTLVLRDESSRG